MVGIDGVGGWGLSKLTDCQVQSMIERLTMSAESAEQRTGRPAVNTRRKLEWYRQEQRDRAAGRSVQEPQADRRA